MSKYLLTIIHDPALPGSRSHGIDQSGQPWTRFVAPSNPPECAICGKVISVGWTPETSELFVTHVCDDHFEVVVKEAADAWTCRNCGRGADEGVEPCEEGSEFCSESCKVEYWG
jgi:hypothetical protein